MTPRPPTPTPGVAYGYELADRTTSITPAGGPTTSLASTPGAGREPDHLGR